MALEGLLAAVELMGLKREELERKIQQEYVNYFNAREFDKVAGLCKATGIKPREEVVKEGYDFCIRNKKFEDILRLQEATGIKARFTITAVHQAYTACLAYGYPKQLKDVQALTGINPPEDIIQIVQESYIYLVEHDSLYNYSTLRKMREATGIEFSEECISTVQEKYASFVVKNKSGFVLVDSIQPLYEATGIRPAEDLIPKIDTAYTNARRFVDLINLHEAIGIEPAEEIYKYFISYQLTK